jgi:hypothetical protein
MYIKNGLATNLAKTMPNLAPSLSAYNSVSHVRDPGFDSSRKLDSFYVRVR